MKRLMRIGGYGTHEFIHACDPIESMRTITMTGLLVAVLPYSTSAVSRFVVFVAGTGLRRSVLGLAR